MIPPRTTPAIRAFGGYGCFPIDQGGEESYKPFYKEGYRHIVEIASQKVGHAGTDACCQESICRTENDAGQDLSRNDSVTRMDISAGSRRGDLDGHGKPHMSKPQQSGQNNLLCLIFHRQSTPFSFSFLYYKRKLAILK